MATSEKHIASVSPMTAAAIRWLDAHRPNEDHCEPSHVIISMLDSDYPGGFNQFREDFVQATAVS